MRYWLMKSEPSECSVDDAAAAPNATVPWVGVRNFQARNFMKDAMRAKDSARLLTIRGLLAALKQREVDERIELDDAAVIAIVDKLVKQRKDSIQQFTAGGRQDLVDKEAAELKVLEGYLPQRMTSSDATIRN